MGDFFSPGEALTPRSYAAAVARGEAGPRPVLELRMPAAFVPPKPPPSRRARPSGAAQRAARKERGE